MRPGRPRIYPLDTIPIGGSAFIPNPGICGKVFHRRISTLAGKTIGKGNFRTRRVMLNGRDGVKVNRL